MQSPFTGKLIDSDDNDMYFLFSEFCWGKAMVANAKPQQWKKEGSERQRGERDQIKFIDLRFERWQVVRRCTLECKDLCTYTLKC